MVRAWMYINGIALLLIFCLLTFLFENWMAKNTGHFPGELIVFTMCKVATLIYVQYQRNKNVGCRIYAVAPGRDRRVDEIRPALKLVPHRRNELSVQNLGCL